MAMLNVEWYMLKLLYTKIATSPSLERSLIAYNSMYSVSNILYENVWVLEEGDKLSNRKQLGG